MALQPRLSGKTAGEFLEEAKSFYFDLALESFAGPLKLLMDFAPNNHILYGTDYPFLRENEIVHKFVTLDSVVDSEGSSLIESTRKTAEILFPRFSAT